MANLTKNSNNQWSGAITLNKQNTTVSFPTAGRYVDKDIVISLDIQNATFKVANQLTDNWIPYIPAYEVETAGYVAAGKQGELNIEWNSF